MIFAVHFHDGRTNKNVLVAAFLMLSDAQAFLEAHNKLYYNSTNYQISEVKGWDAFSQIKNNIGVPA